MAVNGPRFDPMPPPYADLATTWAFLEEGLDHIMNRLHMGISYPKYQALYTTIYNYCTTGDGIPENRKFLPIHTSATHPPAFLSLFFLM